MNSFVSFIIAGGNRQMVTPPRYFPGWGQPLLGGSPFTAADVERIPDDGFRYELYRGMLIRMPANGGEHGFIMHFVSMLLSAYWRDHNERYRIVPHAGFDFTFLGDAAQSTMLVPDVAVTSRNFRYGPGIIKEVPLIAIEIASPSDYRPEMLRKANFLLNGGVKEVWVVWPKTRTVDVWAAPNSFVTLTEPQVITSAQMPGFSSDLGSFFDG